MSRCPTQNRPWSLLKIGRVRCQPLALTAVLVLSVAFAIVAWSSQFSLDTHWDESCDLGIANSLLVDPLRGSPRDPSQARLPMYVTALALGVARPASYESRALEWQNS